MYPKKYNRISSKQRWCQYNFMDVQHGPSQNILRKSVIEIAHEGYELYRINPGSNTLRNHGCTDPYFPSLKPFKTNNICGTLLEKQGQAEVTFFNGQLHMYEPVLVNQQEFIYFISLTWKKNTNNTIATKFFDDLMDSKNLLGCEFISSKVVLIFHFFKSFSLDTIDKDTEILSSYSSNTYAAVFLLAKVRM